LKLEWLILCLTHNMKEIVVWTRCSLFWISIILWSCALINLYIPLGKSLHVLIKFPLLRLRQFIIFLTWLVQSKLLTCIEVVSLAHCTQIFENKIGLLGWITARCASWTICQVIEHSVFFFDGRHLYFRAIAFFTTFRACWILVFKHSRLNVEQTLMWLCQSDLP